MSFFATSIIEEGVVPGGGMTLFQISKKLTGNTIGERIMRAALKAPLKQIISNAWLDYSDIVGNMPKGMGYDAKNNKYVNMVKSGIIDPAKVERCCIENAVSFTGVFLTIQHIVALKKEIPKENE